MHVPPEACGGARHVVAVCPEHTETARAAQDRESLLLRFTTQDEARAVCIHKHLISFMRKTCFCSGLFVLSSFTHRRDGRQCDVWHTPKRFKICCPCSVTLRFLNAAVGKTGLFF